MAWSQWYTSFSDAFKKRAGRYLINRYLGTLLDETISLHQLTVDGAISLSNVALNIRTINKLIDDADLPVEFVDGYIQNLSVSIPWSNLLTESCFFSIDGLTITLQVKKRVNPAQISASIFHSMCESFSSFNVAEDCMKRGDVESSPGKQRGAVSEEDMVAGVELLAQAIDSVIMRVQVRLTNTTVRLEHLPGLEQQGLALQLQLGKLVYRGQAGQEEDSFSTSTLSKIFFEDVILYTDEFSLNTRRQTDLSTSQSQCPDEEEDQDNDIAPPLQLASLMGNQELILRFSEFNQFGLPRSIDEVELNLSTIQLHVFPHQVHIISEIVSAISVPAKPNPSPPLMSKQHRKIVEGLEGLLQENLRFGSSADVGLNLGWGEDLSSSKEFKPVQGIHGRGQLLAEERSVGRLPHVGGARDEEDSPASPPMPRIILRVAALIAVLKEKDPNISQFGGEPTKALALEVMRSLADQFFGLKTSGPVFEQSRLDAWHQDLATKVCDSHLQLVSAPLTLVYEEGTSIGPGLTSSYAAITKLTLGKLSVVECLIECESSPGSRHQIINLLRFQTNTSKSGSPSKCSSGSSLKNPDVRLVFKDTFNPEDESPVSNVNLQLNSCSLDIDPGLVDRTYLLLNYADLDTDCVKTSLRPAQDQEAANTSIEVEISSPKVRLDFRIPKPDMRSPSEIGADFVRSFWTRKVHPELYTLQMDVFTLKVDQVGGSTPPLNISFSSQTLEASYAEHDKATPFMLLQARRLVRQQQSSKNSYAMQIGIKVCMDDSLRLQGRFSAQQHRMQKSVFVKKDSIEDNYFVVEPDSGAKDEQDTSNFLQQKNDILAALNQALLRNNLLIDIKFDAVSVVLPNKRLYEVIYNRIGNDMLLWLPEYMTAKEHIFGQKIPNPLEDDSSEFSSSFSGRPEQLEYKQKEPNIKHTNAFPKDSASPHFEIHTDTAVSLAVEQVELLVCLPMEADSLGLLHLSVRGLALVSAAGLDKEPEVAIFNLKAREGCVKYGLTPKSMLPPQLHFNPDLGNLEVLVTTNSYCDKAWIHHPTQSDLLNLTSKILLDTTTNLKSIQLAFDIVQGGMVVREPSRAGDWINALKEFFTVVEFPVLGYVPPVVLTELHFHLTQCAIELSPPSVVPARVALCLGKVKVTCSLLDTTQDASVNIAIEDLGVFLSNDAASPVESAICVADIDFFDILISLSEPEKVPETEDSETTGGGRSSVPPVSAEVEENLSVCASCNLLRIRTCADSLQLLVSVLSGFAEEQTVDTEDPGGKESMKIESEKEDILPDLEDAMEELEAAEEAAQEPEKERPQPPGTQVFFFPGEGGARPAAPPPPDAMTQSMYVERKISNTDSEDYSDLDSFCILGEEEGSGIIPSSGEPTIKVLDPEGVAIVENHFAVPHEGMDHLKAPSGFPLSLVKVALTKLSLVWQVYGGNDFSTSKEMKYNTKAKLQKMGMSVIEERKKKRHFSASKPGSSSARQMSELIKTKGGPGRNSEALIELSIYKMAAQHETYAATGQTNSPVTRQILLIPNLEVRDRLADSEINKLLHILNNKSRPRQSSAHMLSIKALTVRPDPGVNIEETALKVSLQPFRINIDQDTLFFLIDFTNSLLPSSGEEPGSAAADSPMVGRREPVVANPADVGSMKYNSGMQAIRLEVPEGSEVFEDARSSPPKEEGEDQAVDGEGAASGDQTQPRSKSSTPGPSGSSSSTASSGGGGGNIYFKSFIFSPSVPIRIDYVGKYVDLTQGALTGILAGLAQLNCSEITLRQLEFKQGILGAEKLFALAATAWLADIRSSQLPALLGGVGPMHALLQMVSGLRDLILMPIEQYRKDGRIVRGIQRGTNSFTHSTTMSFLEVTNKLLSVVKFAAELAFDVMSPEGCVVQGKLPHPSKHCRRQSGRTGLRRARGTPHDMREGVLGAMALVREGLDETARSLADAASEKQGVVGAVGGVLRAVPSTMVRPVILGAAATSNLLDGVKNQISPDQRVEEEEKWKTS